MADDSVQRDLGRHDAKLEAVEKDLQDIREQLERMCERMEAINQTLSTAAGGWKTLMLVGGVIAAVFHFIGFVVDKFSTFIR